MINATVGGEHSEPTASESTATTPLSSLLAVSDVEFLDQELDWEELLHLSPIRSETLTCAAPAGAALPVPLAVRDCPMTATSFVMDSSATSAALLDFPTLELAAITSTATSSGLGFSSTDASSFVPLIACSAPAPAGFSGTWGRVGRQS